MKIQDALEETGKAVHECDEFEGCYVCLNDDGQLECKHGSECPQKDWTTPTLQQIVEDCWQPYHPKKEIRPERAGELWHNYSLNKYYHSEEIDGVLWMVNSIHKFRGGDFVATVWRLIYSPDEEVMKELEGEKVVVEKKQDSKKYIELANVGYPSLKGIRLRFDDRTGLLISPKMLEDEPDVVIGKINKWLDA
jgi:hypothetical protein